MSVRITQGTTNRSYLKNLNNSHKSMNDAMERVETGRDFTRASQNVSGATKAIDIRSKLYKNEQNQNNVNTALEQLSIAEDAVAEMNDICSTIYADMLKAMNGSNLHSAKSTFITTLDGAKEEIMRLANSTYNNKYVMGGLDVDKLPFSTDDNGNLLFKEVEISTIEDRQQILKDYERTSVPVRDRLMYSDCDEFGFWSKEVCEHNELLKPVSYDELKLYLGKTDEEMTADLQLRTENVADGHFWIPSDLESHNNEFVYHCDLNERRVTIKLHKLSDDEYASYEENRKKTNEQLKQSLNSNENYFSSSKPIKNTGDNYMDIGLDLSISNGTASSKSAFKTTVDGINILGYGKTQVSYEDIKTFQKSQGIENKENATSSNGTFTNSSEEVSNNICDMMNEMKRALEDEDIDKLSAVLVNFQKATDNLIAQRSEIGVRTKYLENNLNRLENENTSLLKMQKDTEGVDDATEITNFMGYQNAWNLVLQFGKNVVSKSLMDYVN